jgi:hypothetical protein
VHSAALPGRPDQNFGDRLLEPEVTVRGDQADTAQAAADQLPQEAPPELEILGRPTSTPSTSRSPVLLTPVAISTAMEITRPFSRTFSKVASSIR